MTAVPPLGWRGPDRGSNELSDLVDPQMRLVLTTELDSARLDVWMRGQAGHTVLLREAVWQCGSQRFQKGRSVTGFKSVSVCVDVW